MQGPRSEREEASRVRIIRKRARRLGEEGQGIGEACSLSVPSSM